MTTTVADRGVADRIVETIVGERLAACAHVVGPIASTYWWNGAIEHAAEWRCEFVTIGARYAALAARLTALHPYDLPAIVAVPFAQGSADYLRWVESEASGQA